MIFVLQLRWRPILQLLLIYGPRLPSVCHILIQSRPNSAISECCLHIVDAELKILLAKDEKEIHNNLDDIILYFIIWVKMLFYHLLSHRRTFITKHFLFFILKQWFPLFEHVYVWMPWENVQSSILSVSGTCGEPTPNSLRYSSHLNITHQSQQLNWYRFSLKPTLQSVNPSLNVSLCAEKSKNISERQTWACFYFGDV